jgi:hypothetical protein
VSGQSEFSRVFQGTENNHQVCASRQRRLIVYDLSMVAHATREILLLERALKRTAKFNQLLRDKNYRLFLR